MIFSPQLLRDLGRLNVIDSGPSDDDQLRSAVAALDDGRFAVIWEDRSGIPSDPVGLRGRFLDPDGDPEEEEFLVFDHFNGTADGFPSLDALPDGGFVLGFQMTPTESSLRTIDFAADGAVRRINGNPDSDPRDERDVDVAALPGGGAIAVYEAHRTRGGTEVLFTVNSETSPGGIFRPFVAIDALDQDQINPTVATLAGGEVVIAWQLAFSATDQDVRYAIVDAGGDVVVAADFHAFRSSDETDPAVAALAGGGFVIAHADSGGFGADADGAAVVFRIYDAGGEAQEEARLANVTTSGSQIQPRVVGLADGGFLVTWLSDPAREIRGRRFDADGEPVGEELLIGAGIENADLDIAPGGDALVTWTGLGGPANLDMFGALVRVQSVTDGADDLFGTAAADVVFAAGGEDTVRGFGGQDRLSGGSDGDALIGGGGRDRLAGQSGADDLSGGVGADTLLGGGGGDSLDGGGGGDSLDGAGGRDRLSGKGGDDALEGGGGGDRLNGGGGDDEISGGRGGDVIKPGRGQDTLRFERGDGRDVVLDWKDGADLIRFETGAKGFRRLEIDEKGRDVVIDYGRKGDSIVLKRTDAEDLDASDFLFG